MLKLWYRAVLRVWRLVHYLYTRPVYGKCDGRVRCVCCGQVQQRCVAVDVHVVSDGAVVCIRSDELYSVCRYVDMFFSAALLCD